MKTYRANIIIYYSNKTEVTKDIEFKATEGWRHIENIQKKAEEQFSLQIVCNKLEEVKEEE